MFHETAGPSQEVPAPGYGSLLPGPAAHPPGQQAPAPAQQDDAAQQAPPPSPLEADPPPPPAGPLPRVLIVGGSMGGCCAALALGQLGCPVTVCERAAGELPSQGAGLVVQPDLASFLLRCGVVQDMEEVCVRSAGRQYIDGEGGVVGGDTNPQLFTAWDVLHRAIKAKLPPGTYRSGATVTSVEAPPGNDGGSSGVGITLESGERLDGDLVVGCDGPGSLVRRTFLPDVRSEYQGYVAWRGLVEESKLPRHVLDFLGNKFTVHQMPRSHILAYLIPGADGSTQAGRRRVNWVWYVNCPEESLPPLLRDVHGRQHVFSVPRGLLCPQVAAERKEAARKELPPVLADMVEHTPDVFVQAIHDLLSPRLALSNRCCLLGDAGCILRPHTAAGTTKAAVNAVALATSLQRHAWQLGPALREYDASQRQLAEHLVGVGRRIGTQSQFPDRMA